MKKTLGAELSHYLKSKGVDIIFGIPGVHNQELYRGIEEAGIQHILARHEQGAGFMADGFSRATGFPGVAYVISGPGICNIMTPMGQAYSDSVPMLVISSALDESILERGRGRLHEMKDQRLAAETVCDWSEIANDDMQAFDLIDKAFLEFRTQRKRPKHIQVPIWLLESKVKPYSEKRIELSTEIEAEIDPNLTLVKDLFKDNPKVMFIFGGGASHCSTLARTVLSKLNAASFSTFSGRGIISPKDKLSFGSYLSRKLSIKPISEAEVVIAVGTSLSEVDIWRKTLGTTGRFIWVNSDSEAFSDDVGSHERVICDSELFLRHVLDNTTENISKHWIESEISDFKRKCELEVSIDRPGIVPLCHALRDCTPDNTMFFSDMTQFAYVAKEVITMPAPNLWHHPYGFGTLGYALPAAIGAAVGKPDDPIVVIVGDYGFQYTLPELATAVELNLSLPIVLWDNGKLKEIEDSMLSSQIAPNAVISKNPNFSKLAEAYGIAFTEPESIKDFQSAIGEAFSRCGPTLIHIKSEIDFQD